MHAFLNWMATNTPTKWCNDSANVDDIEHALESGAVGCTTNPPLSYQTLTNSREVFAAECDKVTAGPGDERAAQMIGVVVRHIARMLSGVYESTGHAHGYVRAQVQPRLADDADAMLKMGRQFASWAPNIMVKIPGTAAGVEVIEELAAEGIATTPTVNSTASQIIAVAEAHERGVARAKAAGLDPAPSTAAIVLGRLQDFLAALNTERNAGVSTSDLESAGIALVKRAYRNVRERSHEIRTRSTNRSMRMRSNACETLCRSSPPRMNRKGSIRGSSRVMART